MEKLSSKSLTSALLKCNQGPKTTIGLFMSSTYRAHDWIQALSRMNSEHKIPGITSISKGARRVFFENGSSIVAVCAKDIEQYRGLNVDEVLYDEFIQDYGLLCDIARLEDRCRAFKKKWHPCETEMEVDPEPLDAFLSEFSVHKT